MKINKAYTFRLYPNDNQKDLLAQHFGACRFVYNYFLRQRIDYYAANKGNAKKGLTYSDTSKMLTTLKNQPEYVWLKAINAQSLQQSLRHLDVAYNNFFNNKTKFPKFKNKHSKQSFLAPQHFSIDVQSKLLYLPKFNSIPIVIHRDIDGVMKSITISKSSSGKYFASILCELDIDVKQKQQGDTIGIDLGIKSFIVTSTGETIDAPKFLRKSELKLKRLQRLLSRKQKGSNRRNKAKIKVACVHDKITNQRKDFLHKLSHKLVSESQAIFVEDLNVKGMLANHKLAKSIADSGWSEFIQQLKYKSNWNGVYFGQVDRFFPSSKRCNNCGWINTSLSLKDREWTCRECNTIIDRDNNAAKNILQFGLLQSTEGHSETKRPGRPRAVRRVVELGSYWALAPVE